MPPNVTQAGEAAPSTAVRTGPIQTTGINSGDSPIDITATDTGLAATGIASDTDLGATIMRDLSATDRTQPNTSVNATQGTAADISGGTGVHAVATGTAATLATSRSASPGVLSFCWIGPGDESAGALTPERQPGTTLSPLTPEELPGTTTLTPGEPGTTTSALTPEELPGTTTLTPGEPGTATSAPSPEEPSGAATTALTRRLPGAVAGTPGSQEQPTTGTSTRRGLGRGRAHGPGRLSGRTGLHRARDTAVPGSRLVRRRPVHPGAPPVRPRAPAAVDARSWPLVHSAHDRPARSDDGRAEAELRYGGAEPVPPRCAP
ncbi:hypothetical protein [Nonomuraea maritima]|uniref:hypothetical protein n=1 Tax=Nonomuraea maritima TaxID=683260 RepID=UPI00371C4686